MSRQNWIEAIIDFEQNQSTLILLHILHMLVMSPSDSSNVRDSINVYTRDDHEWLKSNNVDILSIVIQK